MRRLVSFLVTLTSLAPLVQAPNPYSENVVALNPDNWKKEVLDYPHAVFIMICTIHANECHKLVPEWEKVAKSSVKEYTKLAYWDLDQPTDVPKILGKVKRYPSLRLLRPRATQKITAGRRKYHDKDMVDFDDSNRKQTGKEMQAFLVQQMPSHVWKIRVTSDIAKIEKYCQYYKLPQAIFFTSKDKESPLLKYLSVQFKNRILIVHAPPTHYTGKLRAEYKLMELEDLPALIIKQPDGSKTKYKNGGMTLAKVEYFLAGHARLEPIVEYKEPPAAADDGEL